MLWAICHSCLERPEALYWLQTADGPIRLAWVGATCHFCGRRVGRDLADEQRNPHRGVLAYDW